MNQEEYVILVDENDNEIGTEKKLVAHQQGKLHRALSVFVLCQSQKKLQTLLQQRQFDKYHSGGLWTNTCCSHPAPGEDILAAAKRRLAQEMGMRDIDLHKIGCFQYRADLNEGLVEHEVDHVFIGWTTQDHDINFDIEEVANYAWRDIEVLQEDLRKNPQNYTAWFAQALDLVLRELQ